ncbi:hypothetical protein [Rhizobium leguminosarum]|uniref:Uncharacterized protein n=1 Tax=Rhizobium leguminosarum TaxID=384 RepID=A0A1B1CJQ1_RHILE|nr:hypothetical protein [Rhizobium leguminosarum]ANP89951.1 hypothetical protein BA011_30260 [Rhizobium leguminosarum]
MFISERLRAVLYEYGQVIPQGIGHIKRIDAIIENTEIGLPEIVQEECSDLLAQIGEKTARIEENARKLAVNSLNISKAMGSSIDIPCAANK